MSKVTLAVGDLVEVYWWDAATSPRWRTTQEVADCKPWPCKTAGYLVDLDLDEDNGYITVTQTVAMPASHDSENPEKAANVWTIPMGCVTDIKRK